MDSYFITIQSKLYEDERLLPIDTFIIGYLQFRTGKNGYCWQSYNHIASDLHISRRTVIRSMNRLVKYNYVIKVNRTIDDTEEQTSNCYYINQNPDAGEEKNQDVVSGVTPQKNEKAVSKCHYPVVSNCHSEKENFFEKNAHAHARTHEDTQDTPKGETESGLLPEAKPDELKLSVPYNKSSDEDIRLCKQVSAEWKRAFNKSLRLYGDFLKTKQRLCFRLTQIHENDFDYSAFLRIFHKFTENNIFFVKPDFYFEDEGIIDYDA